MATILAQAFRVGSRNSTFGRVKPWSFISSSPLPCSRAAFALFLITRSRVLRFDRN